MIATLGVFLLRDLPQDPKPASNTPSKFDYLGSFILVLMLVSLMIIIINGGAWGWLSLTTILLAVIFLVCISLFYRIENKRGKEALIDLQLFKSKKFSGAT
ncbi:MAG: MFS transporter, partial [Prevotella bivia]|nr:MFS transporter [Prevotella bivia]